MMNLTGFQRFFLFQTLPSNAGSLDELVTIKNLRKRIDFSDAQKEEIGWSQTQQGQLSFNPSKMSKLDEEGFEFSDQERSVIASGFLLREANENLPTHDEFISLYLMFKDDIDAKKE